VLVRTFVGLTLELDITRGSPWRATFGELRGRSAITVVVGGAAEDPEGTNYCTL
jgi:hypothetical protein